MTMDWRAVGSIALLAEDLIEDRSEPYTAHGQQLLHNPFISDLSGIIVRVQLEQRPVRVVVRRAVELFWPGPVASELVDRFGPTPRAYRLVVRFARIPHGFEHGLIVTARCRGALDPRLEFAGPGLVDTSDEDPADQRIVLVPVQVLLDIGGERFRPFGRGCFDGPVD